MDWNINGASTAEWQRGLFGRLPHGRIDMQDTSYDLLGDFRG